jgi:hypothetical protein
MNDEEWNAIRPVIVRLRASLMAVAAGVLGGFGLFVSTIWLVQRGGQNVGQHLSLLSNYFPGYRVSWGGAFIGFGYGALTGGAIGYSVAWVYNYVLLKRLGSGVQR